jgi:hypothetical protein
MATIERIDTEINAILRHVVETRKTKPGYKASKELARVGFLNHLKIYLQTNPSEEYLSSELARLEAKIKTIEGNFNAWTELAVCRGIHPSKFKPAFNTEMGLASIRLQIKAISFLLHPPTNQF